MSLLVFQLNSPYFPLKVSLFHHKLWSCCCPQTPNHLAHLKNALNALPLGVLPILTVQQSVWVTDELHEALGLGAAQHWVLEVIAVLTQRLKAPFSYPFLKKLIIRGWGTQGGAG